ncbi:MAG: hypothetical protein JJ869_12185 [Marivita sp.]|uniref:hypothetical protein n=1 Tax=Marivita sp. TaxID=2003365 RepID=UPI001B10345D|nr:hypothetical protein [Marivita sp.]MBO6884320.1 hypothetical protein [Marivita sp.]
MARHFTLKRSRVLVFAFTALIGLAACDQPATVARSATPVPGAQAVGIFREICGTAMRDVTAAQSKLQRPFRAVASEPDGAIDYQHADFDLVFRLSETGGTTQCSMSVVTVRSQQSPEGAAASLSFLRDRLSGMTPTFRAFQQQNSNRIVAVIQSN